MSRRGNFERGWIRENHKRRVVNFLRFVTVNGMCDKMQQSDYLDCEWAGNILTLRGACHGGREMDINMEERARPKRGHCVSDRNNLVI